MTIFDDQASVFKFDTEANEWSTLAPMFRACYGHSVSVLDGLVYIVGAGESSYDVRSFDPSTGLSSALAPTSISRWFGASFVLGGCLYMAGGGYNRSTSVDRYDVASNTWTPVANMLETQDSFCAVTIGSAGPAEEQDLFDSLIAKSSV
jgi:hypothetical protein